MWFKITTFAIKLCEDADATDLGTASQVDACTSYSAALQFITIV